MSAESNIEIAIGELGKLGHPHAWNGFVFDCPICVALEHLDRAKKAVKEQQANLNELRQKIPYKPAFFETE